MSHSKQSRRNFLQRASILGAGLPLATLNGLRAEEVDEKSAASDENEGPGSDKENPDFLYKVHHQRL